MPRRIPWLQFVPQEYRHHLIRRALQITPITTPEFRVQIATTKEDLEKAYGLLHGSYVATKLMSPHPSGLRCTLFSALPFTTVIVAKMGDQVIGTVSLIKDSEVGFPSDKDYLLENNSYRQQGFQMVEVSALAIHQDHRGRGHAVSLHLMKYLYEYARYHMSCDMLCVTVHPRARDFYTALMGFQQNGKIVQYEFVNGALATHMTLDLNRFDSSVELLYDTENPRKNFAHFVLQQKVESFRFPERKLECSIDPVMTPDLLRYFFVEKTNLFETLNSWERSLVKSAYALYFETDALLTPGDEVSLPNRPFRYLTHIQAALVSRNQMQVGTIYDLSTGGAFFGCKETLASGLDYELIFNMKGELFRIPAVLSWKNVGTHSRYPSGYGLRFLVSDLRLERVFKEAHLNRQELAIAEERIKKPSAA